MALVDYFRGERIRGRVIDVYNTDKNKMGAVVEAGNGSRYAVNFSVGNNFLNKIFTPFLNRQQNLERLIKPEVYIDVATEYSKNPFKVAYKLNQVSSQPIYKRQASSAVEYA